MNVSLYLGIVYHVSHSHSLAATRPGSRFYLYLILLYFFRFFHFFVYTEKSRLKAQSGVRKWTEIRQSWY